METLQNNSDINPRADFLKRMLSGAARTASWLLRGMPEPGRQQPHPGRGWYFPDSDVPTVYDNPYSRQLAAEAPDGIVDLERLWAEAGLNPKYYEEGGRD